MHKWLRYVFLAMLYCCGGQVLGQLEQSKQKVKKASLKIESGLKKNNPDTLAQGYYDLGQNFYEQGDPIRGEMYFKKAKLQYEKMGDAYGVAKSSRALAKVQEDLNKNTEALGNYQIASDNNLKTGDINSNTLNRNDFRRYSK
jgi:hypothetical protein